MKKIVASLLMAVTVLSLAACGDNNTKTTQTTTAKTAEKVTGKTINMGILPAESAIPIILAQEKGFFKEAGTDVAIKSFASPNDRNVAVQSKQLDGTISDVMTEATFKKNGIDMKITSGILEDFKILASPQSKITEMKGLAGKKVTLVPNFILEYIMDDFAKKDGFTYEVVNIPSFSARSEALLSGQVDGAVYTEPQASMLAKQGAKILGSSKDAKINGGTLQFTDAILKERPQDIRAFYQGYNHAIDYMNQHKASEYADILTKYQFPAAMSTYLDSQEKDYPHAQKVDQDQFDAIIQWAKNKKQIEKKYSYEQLTNFSYLTK
ncbi:nitrate ABC transporter substrate-binding protein [Enterococcus saigonensis]|uniref:Nitrate ABC transporter substrate-binding protein n=1 Tax=Enterococcus saigonensis TaxID=1805431 RepID=A0A679IPZ1_9ENTE|nr:ABC transporter substrate-binding protein [Enterococcus saigonensis]BCA87021.1 nitrate ABC transporter substrate-binding protein [Enterococcus saigonensis]